LQEGKQVEAGKAFAELDGPGKKRVDKDLLTDQERVALWSGLRKADRQMGGEGEGQAYRSLSRDQKRAAGWSQSASIASRLGYQAEAVEEHLGRAEEAMSALSEEERQEVKAAVPEQSMGGFEEVLSRIDTGEDKSRGESQDGESQDGESQDEGRSRGYGSRGYGYDRGMGI
jgi:hypothetical protein